MAERRPLPGPMIDLASEGIRGPAVTRSDVVKATRQIMLSAHRAGGWSYADIHVLLTDTTARRLAKQIGTGRGGRPISPGMVMQFLDRHWRETAKVAAERPAWNRDDVEGFIDLVRDAVDGADIPTFDRDVLEVILDLAAMHGTTRPAAPVRTVVERLGLDATRSRDCMRVHRRLARLAEDGIWIRLAKRGSRTRANLYALAPALAETYTGATPPTSQGLPTSHPPMSHPEEGSDMAVIELHGSEKPDLLRFLALPEAERARLLAMAGDAAPSRHLRAVSGGKDAS
jgi:hypothetical protein